VKGVITIPVSLGLAKLFPFLKVFNQLQCLFDNRVKNSEKIFEIDVSL